MYGPPIQEWEDAVWDDLYVDAAGNILKPKNDPEGKDAEEELEIMSSPSVRERRKLQEATDWPLSARGQLEKNLIKEKNVNREA